MASANPIFCKNPKVLTTLAVVALVFGGMTVFSGGMVLFGPEASRTAAGDYVPFVVWFNFLAGFAYMAAAVGLYFRAKWGASLAMAIAVASATVFTALGVEILSGTAFEMRTVAAMTLRTGLWGFIALVARKNLLQGE